MYARQFGYQIVAGQEEKAVALCRQFADALCQRGIQARVVIDRHHDSNLQLVEEYQNYESMLGTRAALECDENFRSAVCSWAADFYPLVQAAAPATISHERLAA